MSTSAPPATARAWLELPDGKLHWLSRECRIGRRREGNDLVIEERLVSSNHVHLVPSREGYTLIDQHSTNGTYLNGLLAQKSVELKDGDEIRLARVVLLRFRCTREVVLDAPEPIDKTTVQANSMDTRFCWLLLADVAGYSGLIAQHGGEAALFRLQTWIAEMRPLLEGNGGQINSYVGDAIFAYWLCDLRAPDQVLAAVRVLEEYRARSPVPFRLVLHHGVILFSKSARGEELSGQEVNFLFRTEKLAKQFACETMLSEAAVTSLHLMGQCESVGASGVDGIEGKFTFYKMPRPAAVAR
jgi:class 3 adenylate cyclase